MFKKSILEQIKALSPEEKTELKSFLNGEAKAVEQKEEAPANEESQENKEGTLVETNSEEPKEEISEAQQEPKEEENAQPDENAQPQVAQVEPTGNGLRIEDLVTKDDLIEKLAAFESKFEAVIKENDDLKNKVSQLTDKYEEKDFGSSTKKGTLDKDKSSKYSSFEEYSKNFM